MIACPDCGHQNIEGADLCEGCQQPLQFLSKPRPSTDVEQRILKDRIRTLNPRKVIVATPSTPVSEVLELLVERGVGCIVIVDGDELVGIFSERDALHRLNVRFGDLGKRPIAEFMTPSPETLAMDDKIAVALHKMDLGGYRHLPVLEGDKVTGVISVRDILRYLSETILPAEVG